MSDKAMVSGSLKIIQLNSAKNSHFCLHLKIGWAMARHGLALHNVNLRWYVGIVSIINDHRFNSFPLLKISGRCVYRRQEIFVF